MESRTKQKGLLSGRLTTIKEYFENNPQSIHIINNNPLRQGVVLNGEMIEIGSVAWKMVESMAIYHDILLGEIRILYHQNNK